LLGTLGWRAALLYCDPCAFDRWLWIRRRGLRGRAATLDAGSGNGAFAMYAARDGGPVTALSYSRQDQEKARRRAQASGIAGIRFEVRDLRELDGFAEALGSYDQVFCLEVIEHIRDDRKLLRDLARVTRPGGTLLLTTPYRDHVPFFGEIVSEREDGHHVRVGYTHEEMRRLLEEAGFRVASQAFLSGVISQKTFNLMYRLDRIYPHLGWAVTLPLRLLRPLDPALTRLLRYPHLSIAVVAVRD
jgi:2-polyprenyl-3-methyl-5-hydroxy-6-metoxy-1,4-benzoquinol methylase